MANLTTAEVPTTSPWANAKMSQWINRGLELLWLLAAVFVPLAFIDRDYAVSEAVIAYVEVPKVALLRVLAGLMTILWLLEWAIFGRLPSVNSLRGWILRPRPSLLLGRAAGWLRASPTRWLVAAVWFFLATTLLSTVLSGSFTTSMWGEIPGQDGYSAYTVIAYVILFGVITTHLKTKEQLWRLLGAIITMGVLVTGYGILQHFGHDFLDLTESTGGGIRRVTSSMGNTIFAAAVMSMTIPVSLAVATATSRQEVWTNLTLGGKLLQRVLPFAMTGIWSLVLAVQLLGIMFTFSRGPWMGTMIALGSFLGLTLLFVGFRSMTQAALILGLAGGLSLAFLHWQGNITILGQGPWFAAVIALAAAAAAAATLSDWRKFGRVIMVLGFVGVVAAAAVIGPSWFQGQGGGIGSGVSEDDIASGSTTGQVTERLSSIRTEVLGGFVGGRGTHWKVSWSLIQSHPWFEFDSLSLRWLRPIIGYGPDLFRYTYLLESPVEEIGRIPLEPDHAHNYYIHQTVEQGFLGLLSSAGIFLALIPAGIYLFLRRNQDSAGYYHLLLTGLLATLLGRSLEMMVGVARISDLTILWVLLGIFAVIPVVMRNQAVARPPQSSRSSIAPRRNRRSTHSSRGDNRHNWSLFWRLSLVAWLAGLFIMLSWIKGVNYVRAAVEEGKAVQDFKQGNWQSSMFYLDRAIELAPDVPSYYNNRALLYERYRGFPNMGREQGCRVQTDLPYPGCLALRSLESNLEGADRGKYYYRSRLALAASAQNLNLHEQAVTFYEDSLALLPSSWEIMNELGNAYIEAKQPQKAKLVLDKSLVITQGTNESARALFLQGMAHSDMGELEQSAKILEQSLALNYGNEEGLEFLQDVYAQLGRPSSIDYFDQAISQNPEDAVAFYNRGLAYTQLGYPDRAVDDLRRSISLGLGLPRVVAALGIAWSDKGNHDTEARRILYSAVTNEPQNPLFHALMGDFYRKVHSFGEAAQYLNRAIELDPGLGLAYSYRGQLFSDQGRFQEAIQELDEAIRLDPKLAHAYNTRGEIYLQLGQVRRAILDFDDAIRFDSIQAQTYNNRAQALSVLGQHQQAILDLRRSLDLTEMLTAPEYITESSRAHYLLGAAQMVLGQRDQAARSLEQSLSLRISSPWADQALTALSQIYADLPAEDSLVRLDGLIQQEPMNPVFYFGRGLFYDRTGQRELAAEDYTHSMALGLRSAMVLAARGIALSGISNSRARIDFLSAVSKEPQNPLYHAFLGDFYRQVHSFGEAAQYLDQAIELDPGLAIAYSYRGQLFSDQGRFQEAIQELDEAIRLDPKLAHAYAHRALAFAELAMDGESQRDVDQALALGFKSSLLMDRLNEIKKRRR